MSKKLLVIDDESGHRLMVRAVMEDAGWEVLEAGSGEQGLEVFSSVLGIDVVLVDMKMPGMNGQQTLAAIHEKHQGIPVVLLTAYGTVGSAVEAMKQGAFDYLTKPADNDELILALSRAWEYSILLRENNDLKLKIAEESALHKIIGSSPAIVNVHKLIQQIAPSEATVLVTGESGTGKELIAEALHLVSSRSKKPFIKVNCAALPEHLLESEMFGYQKGAFTGANKDKAGRFQLADSGTILLDEVGEIPLNLQAKLLRAIQERIIEPLGAIASKAVDVRIIASTNRDLQQLVAKGLFREDLFFRLNVLEIHSPPLREHLEDLPLLVSHLLQAISEKNKKIIRGVSPAFLQKLSVYQWPGNVRELENMLERAVVLSRSDILGIEDLPATFDEKPNAKKSIDTVLHDGAYEAMPQNYRDYKDEELTSRDSSFLSKDENSEIFNKSTFLAISEEEKLLLSALQKHQGHREKTAEELGISRRTLQYRLKKLGLRKRS